MRKRRSNGDKEVGDKASPKEVPVSQFEVDLVLSKAEMGAIRAAAAEAKMTVEEWIEGQIGAELRKLDGVTLKSVSISTKGEGP